MTHAMNIELARHHMIQHLRTCECMSPAVVEQMYASRREHYVPAGRRSLAFADAPLPLGARHDAVMLTPKLEARILQVADLPGDARVLEIGTGSGYMAALLADRAAAVWTIEIDPTLAEQARTRLAEDGVDHVTVVEGDGLAGLPDHAPYDFILVSGGVASVPAALLGQLRVGGRLLAFVGKAPVMTLRLTTRTAEDACTDEDLFETAVPYLQGAQPGGDFRF